jgi:hypothetical protein
MGVKGLGGVNAPVQVVTQTAVGGASDPKQSAPEAPATESVRVPKGQLDRTRKNIPQGWMNDGGHDGFKPASIEQVADGYYLAAVHQSDVPKGQLKKH